MVSCDVYCINCSVFVCKCLKDIPRYHDLHGMFVYIYMSNVGLFIMVNDLIGCGD